MSEPTRLRDRPELPNTLREALRSLEEQAPADRTVARIQQQLEALPPSPAPVLHAGAKLGLKLTALATSATIGLSAVWMWQHERTAPSAHAPVATGATRDDLHERPDQASEAATAGPVTEAPATVTSRGARSVQASPAGPMTHPDRRREKAASNGPQTDTGRGVAAPGRRNEPSAASVAPVPSETSQQAALAPQRGLVAQPDAGPSGLAHTAARPAETEGADSEASLIYRAKHLEVRDPAVALRLLEGHARDFPNGAFAEERYALSIRILERLGHTPRAAQLRREFQARFPSSVYQTTLTP